MADTMTIGEAINYIQDINNRKKMFNEQENEHLTTSKQILQKLSSVLGDSANVYQEIDNLVKKGRETYDTSASGINDGNLNDFNLWAKTLYEEIEKYQTDVDKVVWQEANTCKSKHIQEFYKKNTKARKGLKNLYIFILVFSLVTVVAVIVLMHFFNEKPWFQTVATGLGLLDFACGVIAFVWERLNDMKTQEVDRTSEELDKALASGDVESISKATTNCINVIKNSIITECDGSDGNIILPSLKTIKGNGIHIGNNQKNEKEKNTNEK